MSMKQYGVGAVLLFLALPAHAEDRDYCPARPGLGTTACTISPKRVSVETAVADWTLENDADTRTDTVLIGDTLVRVGLTDTIEAQIGWTPYGHVRTRDKASGTIDRVGRTGDVTLGFKANLVNPDGKGFSIGMVPYVVLPVGRTPIGGGDWGAGVVVPVSYELSDAVSLQFTGEADAAVDQDGRGRHFAYSGVGGLGVALTSTVTATGEIQLLRDDDPSDATTQALASLSLAWMANPNTQLDVGGVAGLNRASPDAELYVGISRRF